MQKYSIDSALGEKVVTLEYMQYQKRKAQLGYDGDYSDERIQKLSQEISTKIEQTQGVEAANDVPSPVWFAAKVQAILDPRKYDNNKFWSIIYSKGLDRMNFSDLNFKNGGDYCSAESYLLYRDKDKHIDYFAFWPNIGDVIHLLSSKAAGTEIINACALKDKYKVLVVSSFGLDDPNDPNFSGGSGGSNDPVVPGLYGNHYSFDNGLTLAAQEIARMDASFLLKLAALLLTLGIAGLVVACTVLSGPPMVVVAALGGLSTLAGIGLFAQSQFTSAPAPVVAQHAI